MNISCGERSFLAICSHFKFPEFLVEWKAPEVSPVKKVFEQVYCGSLFLLGKGLSVQPRLLCIDYS